VFLISFSDIDQLLAEPATNSRNYPHRLLYVNVITALESYLSDFFVSRVKADKALLRKFVETTPAFREQKVSISDVFGAMESIEKRAYSHLAGPYGIDWTTFALFMKTRWV
jgi:hypothetical protein